MTSPMIPILQRSPGNAVDADTGERRRFYDAVHAAVDGAAPAERFVIPARTGLAWPMKAGQVCRIVLTEGPQVVDFGAWNLHDRSERFWSARTRMLHGPHVTTYHRLWSCLPCLRPMLTITHDTVQYGVDADGGGCHDLLGSRCDPYTHMLVTGDAIDCTCHQNLTKAIKPHGLHEPDVHDVLNIFMISGFRHSDNVCFVKASPARKGDYFELFAEIDILCAASACPNGDLSAPYTGPNAQDLASRCHPVGVDVFDVDPALLRGWTSPQPVPFDGLKSYRS